MKNLANIDLIDVEIHESQGRILNIFKIFNDFCEKHEIKYCVIGGTLLGAVRHQGFIPWDDDIDVGVPRNDYERLITLSAALPNPYKFDCYEIDSDYVFPYAKIYDSSTLAVEDFARPFKRGLWIDIFPIDGTYSNKFTRWAHFKIIKAVKGALSTKNKSFRWSEQIGMRRLNRLIVSIIVVFLPKKIIYKILQKLLKLRNYNDSDHVGNMLGRWGEREIMHFDVMDPTGRLQFCDFNVPSPARPDSYLEKVYGDYLKLPPEGQRVSGHAFLEVNLKKSYLN